MLSTTGKKVLSGSGLLIGLFILGAILRLWNLGSPSLWLDEAISFFRGQMSLAQIIRASYGWDVHPPTYYLILYFIEKLGQSEFAIRLFSVLCSIAALPVLFRWVQLQFGKKEALWAVFFQACSIFHLRYSQEARVYVLFYLVSLFVFLYFYKACESGKRKHWFLWACFSILNFNIHYYSLVLLASQILYFIVPVAFQRIRKQKIKKYQILIYPSVLFSQDVNSKLSFLSTRLLRKLKRAPCFGGCPIHCNLDLSFYEIK